MTAIASPEVRQRAIEAYRSGQGTQEQIAKAFGVSYHGFRKWLSAYETEGRLAPAPRGHNPAKFQGELLDEFDEFVAGHRDATLEDIREYFSGRVECSVVTIHKTLGRLGWRLKKRRYIRVSKTATM